MSKRLIEIWVGIFIVLAALALMFLALRVSGLNTSDGLFNQRTYKLSAAFNDIGNLKPRAPVRIAGVEIGSVSEIVLDPKTYQAEVTLTLSNSVNQLPTDTSANIASSGLLGDNYVSLMPGFDQEVLQPGGQIETTYSATSIQNLITAFINGGKSKDEQDKPAT